MTTVSLCMIAKNEEHCIGRCIRSAALFVDDVLIIDTGSTDGTADAAKKAAAETGLPIEILSREWRDFGTNRTELVTVAKHRADYLLLLDADMTVEFVSPVQSIKDSLTEDAYLLRYLGDLDYSQQLLVKGDLTWRYVGATHEYIECPDGISPPTLLGGIRIQHHLDGGSRNEKTTRDIALLEQEWEARQLPRTAFYLAQSYQDAGRLKDAQTFYGIRSTMGGWEEERWVAEMRHGILNRSIHDLLTAWGKRTWRAEPLYYASVLAREEENWHVALMLAQQGQGILYPDKELLFVERWVYEWGLDFEESISLWWCGEKELAAEAGRRLLERGVPIQVAEAIERNQAFS